MKLDIHTGKIKRQRLQLRQAIRKLKRWGDEPEDADSDIAPLRECYQYTVGEGNEDNYLLN
ncbi:MAG: hypothetical protein M3436_11080 [Pseudomonadota bacterium]|nr:hypothetical protein [Pseudomonadota bacterium]